MSVIVIMPTVITVLLIVSAMVGLCFLQKSLSKRNNWWCGLIMPTVYVILTLVAAFGFLGMALSNTEKVSLSTDKYKATVTGYDAMEVYDLESEETISYRVDDETGMIYDATTGNITGINYYNVKLNYAEKQNSTMKFFPILMIMFVLMNIPTAIFMVIYAVQREKIRTKAMLDKMAIQDI